MNSIHSIVLADDGSQEGSRAAAVGLEIAHGMRASVIVVGVVEPPNIQAEGAGLGVETAGQVRQKLEQRLEALLERGRDLGLRMTLQITEGDAADEVLNAAKTQHAGLIVVGRTHLSRFRRWMEGGSTTDAILREAPCAVMVVP